MTATVAKLDEAGRLVGLEQVEDPEGRIEVPAETDLPLDGSYKWSAAHRAFLPLGFGFERVASRPPYGTEFVLRRVIAALGSQAGAEALEWARWYDENLSQRDEERALYRRKAARRPAPPRRAGRFRKPGGEAT